MFKKILYFCLLAFIAVPVYGGEKPEAPVPHVAVEQPKTTIKEYKFSKKLYVLEMTGYGLGAAADWFSTVKGQEHGDIEHNSFLGIHPNTGKIVMYGVAEFVAAGTVLYITEHNHHKPLRIAGRVLVGWAAVNHAQLGITNSLRVNSRDLGAPF